MKKIIYTGLFLREADKEDLEKFWVKETRSELLPKKFMDHVTLNYKPTDEQVLSLPLGENFQVDVVGCVASDKCQAVIVDILDAPAINKLWEQGNSPDKAGRRSRTHITIATEVGTPPSYSNDLIKRAWSLDRGPKPNDGRWRPRLNGCLAGLWTTEGKQYNLDGTQYEKEAYKDHAALLNTKYLVNVVMSNSYGEVRGNAVTEVSMAEGIRVLLSNRALSSDLIFTIVLCNPLRTKPKGDQSWL